MNRLLPALSLVCLLSLASPAWADRAVPDPPPGVTAPLVIKVEKGAKMHKLIIPKKFLAGVKLGQLDAEQDATELSLAGDRGRTVLAGLAFTMAIGSVVVFRGRHVRAAAVLIAGALVLGAGSLSWADIAPPPPPKDKIQIEIVEKGDAVTLIMPSVEPS